MKLLNKIFVLLIFILFYKQNIAQNTYECTSPNQFLENIYSLENNLIIDTQLKKDFVKKHIENAVNLPTIKDLKAYTDSLDRKRPIFIYCSTNVRSSKAAELLLEYGFLYVYVLSGGLDNWIELGLPIVEK